MPPPELILSWVVFSIAVSLVAGARDRSPLKWLGISLLLSPLVGFIGLLAMPGEPNGPERIPCERCGESIPAAAVVAASAGPSTATTADS